jgi:hypothetical protein
MNAVLRKGRLSSIWTDCFFHFETFSSSKDKQKAPYPKGKGAWALRQWRSAKHGIPFSKGRCRCFRRHPLVAGHEDISLVGVATRRVVV